MYDKCWQLDITWAEVEDLLIRGEVIEQFAFDDLHRKCLALVWHDRPLHVVYIVDDIQRVVVYRTIYQPESAHWEPGFRVRKR